MKIEVPATSLSEIDLGMHLGLEFEADRNNNGSFIWSANILIFAPVKQDRTLCESC